MNGMEKWILFGILSVPIIAISLKSFTKPGSHGFYRFFVFECMLWLFLSNYSVWFKDPFSPVQLVSWCLLFLSVYPAYAGFMLLKKRGRISTARKDESLFNFEKTTELVDAGIYKYVRHPLYLSLFLLSWGMFFKNMSIFLLIILVLISVLLYLMARADERECIGYFGNKYKAYMKRTKMFIPFLF